MHYRDSIGYGRVLWRQRYNIEILYGLENLYGKKYIIEVLHGLIKFGMEVD